jgi:Ser/Thr protein kinase RdoA (MazF antagonist)
VAAVGLARRFGLGGAGEDVGWAGRAGKAGLVWRLDTAEGSWAVKVPFRQSGEDGMRSATAFQEAACAAGVPVPQMRRTIGGCVFATLGGRQVRVYEWVDLRAPDAGLDPDRVGAVVAAIHRVSTSATTAARPSRSTTHSSETSPSTTTRSRSRPIPDRP